MEEALQAQQGLSGRKFANRVVVTTFLTEEKYGLNDFTETTA